MGWRITKSVHFIENETIKNDIIEDENRDLICSIVPEMSDKYRKIIAHASEMYEAIKDCLKTSNSSKRFSKKDFDDLSFIIKKIENS